MRKDYRKYLTTLDRFPYILVIVIIGLSLIFFIIIRNNLPLAFFSGNTTVVEDETEYSVFITSPINNKVYNFINLKETIPIEIKSKHAETEGFKVKILVNEDEIKTFNSPPYEYNWNPSISGEYEIMAQLVDENNRVLSESGKVTFVVEYEMEESEAIIISTDIEEKKEQILAASDFRSQNTIPVGVPIFSYKCYTPPLIDGNFAEWDKFEKFSTFEPTIKKENYTTHTDVSGTFYSCWDEDNFYFVAQVLDDVFSQNYTGNQLNKGDSITIVFDTELAEDMQIPFYNSDDYQIDFSPGNFSSFFAESYMSWPSDAPPRGTNIASTKLANGYVIEASIPWYNFIDYLPTDGSIIGFTVSILDTDNLDTTELVLSSSSVFDINNASTLGTLVLIDAGDIQQDEEVPDSTE
ncbi:sugar-binding protein [Actinomycetota bacterium]